MLGDLLAVFISQFSTNLLSIFGTDDSESGGVWTPHEVFEVSVMMDWNKYFLHKTQSK